MHDESIYNIAIGLVYPFGTTSSGMVVKTAQKRPYKLAGVSQVPVCSLTQ
jgi:hypothetical protein